MQLSALPALLLAAAAGLAPSDRSAFNLSIAATQAAPPDLARLIVQNRKEFLAGVREAARRKPAADFEKEAAALSQAVWERTPMAEVIRRCGLIAGEVIAAETPVLKDAEAVRAWDSASSGPYRFPGLFSASAAGKAAAAAASIVRSSSDFVTLKMSNDAIASRIVSDELNLFWAIWTGAGGDARPAGKYDERNGPYTIPGASR